MSGATEESCEDVSNSSTEKNFHDRLSSTSQPPSRDDEFGNTSLDASAHPIMGNLEPLAGSQPMIDNNGCFPSSGDENKSKDREFIRITAEFLCIPEYVVANFLTQFFGGGNDNDEARSKISYAQVDTDGGWYVESTKADASKNELVGLDMSHWETHGGKCKPAHSPRAGGGTTAAEIAESSLNDGDKFQNPPAVVDERIFSLIFDQYLLFYFGGEEGGSNIISQVPNEAIMYTFPNNEECPSSSLDALTVPSVETQNDSSFLTSKPGTSTSRRTDLAAESSCSHYLPLQDGSFSSWLVYNQYASCHMIETVEMFTNPASDAPLMLINPVDEDGSPTRPTSTIFNSHRSSNSSYLSLSSRKSAVSLLLKIVDDLRSDMKNVKFHSLNTRGRQFSKYSNIYPFLRILAALGFVGENVLSLLDVSDTPSTLESLYVVQNCLFLLEAFVSDSGSESSHGVEQILVISQSNKAVLLGTSSDCLLEERLEFANLLLSNAKQLLNNSKESDFQNHGVSPSNVKKDSPNLDATHNISARSSDSPRALGFKQSNASEQAKDTSNKPSAAPSSHHKDKSFSSLKKPFFTRIFRDENQELIESREIMRNKYKKQLESHNPRPAQFTLREKTAEETQRFLKGKEWNSVHEGMLNSLKGSENNYISKLKVLNFVQKKCSTTIDGTSSGKRFYTSRDFEMTVDKALELFYTEKVEFVYSEEFKQKQAAVRYYTLNTIRIMDFNTEYLGLLALDYTNHYRKQRGLNALMWNRDLMLIAIPHSQNIAQRIIPIGHQGVKRRFAQYPFYSRRSAENVATNSGTYYVAKTAVVDWITSPGHEANLRGDFNVCGIGVAQMNGHFCLTQLFGSL